MRVYINTIIIILLLTLSTFLLLIKYSSFFKPIECRKRTSSDSTGKRPSLLSITISTLPSKLCSLLSYNIINKIIIKKIICIDRYTYKNRYNKNK